jgi:hypothetical protein
MKSFVDLVYEIEKCPVLYLRRNSLDLLNALLSGYVYAKIEESPDYKHYSKEFNLYIEVYYDQKMLERLEQIKEAIKMQKEATDATKKAAYESKLNEIKFFSSRDASGLIREHTQNDVEAMWEFFRLFHQFVEEMEVLD